MSASPLVDPPAMPTMVSRLPTFGSRPRSQTTPAATPAGGAVAAAGRNRLTNGFYHHPGPAGLSMPPFAAKQNGFIRVPCSPSTWTKESIADGNAVVDEDAEPKKGKGGNVERNPSNFLPHFRQRQQGAILSQHDARKGRGQLASYSASFSSPSPQSSPRAPSFSKNGSRVSKQNTISSVSSSGAKQSINASLGSKAGTKVSSFLRQPQSLNPLAGASPGSCPGSQSGSPLLKKPTASRSQSSDDLGCAASVQLTENDRFRSRSLTQVRRQASPTLGRTSTNRAAQRLPSPSSSKAPPRGSLLKSPVTRAAFGRGEAAGLSQLPLSTLKKPLLPSPTSRSSGISYKLSRPSLIKQARPLRAKATNLGSEDQEVNRQSVRRKNSVETPSSTENSPEAPETGDLSDDLVSQGVGLTVGETLDDMSLSSTSSMDRNDISQEYMDDFDNLGNGGVGILLFSSKNEEDDSGLDQSCTKLDDAKYAINEVTKTTALCFLDDGLAWTAFRGGKEEHQLNQLTRRRKSSQPDYHEQGGSSLELSPSDSCGSGGTYMWDEEGLEPLGGTTTTASIHASINTTHHIGSCDSDVNSIDLSNNLDSCDLADDDLMLDADFPEDSSLHSDGEGLSSMAQWRRRQLCWGTQDNDNESDIQCYKLSQDLESKDNKIRSAYSSPAPQTLGLDVEELAEDCSAVRSQLEFLQRLLLQEEDFDDDTLTTDTLSPETNDSSHSSDSQVQALLQEVQQLREELRSRDRTIAQLTMQLTVPRLTTECRCLETPERTERQTQTDATQSEFVASQTPWREHTSQVLHPPTNQDNQEPLMSRALTSGNPAHHEMPPDRLPPSLKPVARATPSETDDGKRQRKFEEETERSGSCSRSLMPLQHSKLRIFWSHTNRSVPKSQKPREPSESINPPGLKLKAFSSGSSRLPKPKSH